MTPRSLNPRISTPELLAWCEEVENSAHGVLPLYLAECEVDDVPRALRVFWRRMRRSDAHEVYRELEGRLEEFAQVVQARDEAGAREAAERLRWLLCGWDLSPFVGHVQGLYAALDLAMRASGRDDCSVEDLQICLRSPMEFAVVDLDDGAIEQIVEGVDRLRGVLPPVREDLAPRDVRGKHHIYLGLASAELVLDEGFLIVRVRRSP